MLNLKRKVKPIWLGFLIVALALSVTFPGQAQGPKCTTTNFPTGGSVILCMTAPSDGATVSGDTTVTATGQVLNGSPSIQALEFLLDGTDSKQNHLLTDYSGVLSGTTYTYTFQLPTNYYSNGTHSLWVVAQMRSGPPSSYTTINLTFNNSQPYVNTNSFAPTSGSTTSGQPFVMAATGDGASGELSSINVTNMIKTWAPNLFLYLGDVYEKGTYTEFYNWYGSSTTNFGQFRSVTDYVVGNHEYAGGAGTGYLDYWNIGHPTSPSLTKTWYSFNAAGWHIIGLDANKQQVPPGSAQYSWLVTDLLTNTAACTLAFWHQPLFNIGSEPPASNMGQIWQLLAQNHVDVVLNGHDHDYQRWKPLNGSGVLDTVNGITEFVAGGGGHGTQNFTTSSPLVMQSFTGTQAFGALRMVLNPGGMDFQYINTSGAVIDSGAIPCHGTGADTTPPSVPGNVSAHADSAGHVTINWSASTDNVGVANYRLYKNGQVLTTLSGGTLSYVDMNTALGATYTYRVDAVDPSNNQSAQSSPASATIPTQATLIFTASADSYVDSNQSSINFGLLGYFRTDASPDMRSYLRFDVSNVPSGAQSTRLPCKSMPTVIRPSVIRCLAFPIPPGAKPPSTTTIAPLSGARSVLTTR